MKVMIFGEVAKLIVHGEDVYGEMDAALDGFKAHDYDKAGKEIGKALTSMGMWTKSHVCTNDFCYVVVGMMQYLGDVKGDLRACKGDFQNAWHNFSAGVSHMTDANHKGMSAVTHFTQDKAEMKQGIGEIGDGILAIAKGVSDCHLVEFADILEKLAIKLGIAPQVGWIREVLHILINGKHIEEEIGSACTAYSKGNMVDFGAEIAKLVETLS